MTFDCQRCGACCVGNLDADSYVHVYDVDIARLSPGFVRDSIVRLSRLASAIRTVANIQRLDACVALDGRVGERVRCSIYEQRPDLCRNFEPGSMACRAARDEHRIGDRCPHCELEIDGNPRLCPGCDEELYDQAQALEDDLVDARCLTLKENA